jgi:cation transport ATPase
MYVLQLARGVIEARSGEEVSLALVVLILAMGHHLAGFSAVADARWPAWIQFVLSTPVVLWCGWPFLCAELSPSVAAA